MCLETLEGVESIGGFNVIHGVPADDEGRVSWKDFYAMRKKCPISIDHEENSISFSLQNGPIKEVGVNGCQIDTVIEAAKIIIERLNQKFPCYENVRAMEGLKDALVALADRKAKREARGVEGKSEL